MDDNKEKSTENNDSVSEESISKGINEMESDNTLHSDEQIDLDKSDDVSRIIEEYSAYEDKKSSEEDNVSEKNDTIENDENDLSDDESDEFADEEDNDEELPAPKPKRKKRKKGNGRLIFGLIMTALIVAIAVFCAALALKFAKDFVGIGESNIEVVVDIPMNSGTAEIADILYEEGIIDSTYFFRFYSRVKGSDGTFVAGSHVLSADMSYENIVSELQKGAVDTRESVDIMFYEGITLFDAAKKLEENGVCSADDFLYEFNNGSFGFDFEKLAKINGIEIVDDYAHHPAELKVTLEAAMKMNYNKVIAIHQPFTFSRTAMLLDDFADVLKIPDRVLMTEIMGSREKNTYNIYTKDLAEKIPGSEWYSSFEEVADRAIEIAEEGDMIITLGCGDVYKIAKIIIDKLS